MLVHLTPSGLPLLVLFGLADLIPASLSCPTQCFAPLFSADVAPSRRTQADRLTLNRRGRQLPTGDIQYFQCEIEQDLGRQSRLSHDSLERHASPHTQT
jgi:hypothetical protein